MRTTAAVLPEYGAPFVLEDIHIDEPRDGEVLVRLVATGICHTDVVTQQGDIPFPVPCVLGHEGVGRIEAVGCGVDAHAVGDTVLLSWPWCGQCRNCQSGNPRFCLNLAALVLGGGRADGTTALRRSDGTRLSSHFFGQPTSDQLAIVNQSCLVPIQSSAPVEAVGVLACGITTGAGAVLIAVEPHAARRNLATKYGATEVIDPATTDVVGAIHEICGGTADAALDCTGIPTVIRQTIDSVGMLGTAVLIGGAPAGAEFSADHLTTLSGKRIVGSLGGEGQSGRFVPALLDLYGQGRFPFTELIEYFPLASLNEAIAASANGDVIKPVLRMS